MVLRFIIQHVRKLFQNNQPARSSDSQSIIAEEKDPKIIFIKKWWRPTIYILLAGLIIFHGFVLPISKGQPVDLSGLSMLVAAVLGVF